MRIPITPGVLLLTVLAAAPAAAQRDSLLLGVPADAVPVPTSGVMTRCSHIDPAVIVRTPEDAARISAHPWCRGGIQARPDTALVGVRMGGDCHARYHLRALRSEAERRYYVIATVVYGGCRAGGGGYFWIAIPDIPPEWEIAIRHRRLERGEQDPVEALFGP